MDAGTARRMAPRSLELLGDYSWGRFGQDLVAGLTVGLVALPLAMAFGIASGVTPQAGLYTAVVAGFLVSALGGSRCQIGGPTGAFVVIVAGIVAKHGMDGLATVTVMAGALLVLMGITGFGKAIRFIPRPVTIGFTNGIAVLIASTQIKDFLGLQMEHVPAEFGHRMRALAENIGTVSPLTVAVGAASLLMILVVPRIWKRVPGTIVALMLVTAVCAMLRLPVDTIGSKFHGVPQGLPPLQMPAFRTDLLLPLLPSALTVTFLAAIESLLSAVVADGMSGDRHDSNTELVAQGIANIATPFFGGIPATGAIARTATNIKSGAQTPMAGMIHAVTLLAILLVAAPLAGYVPLATLAAVLFIVAYNMGEWREIGMVLRLSRADVAVWLATFFLTVAADLTVAVEVGIGLACLLYIKRVSETTTVAPVTEEYLEESRAHVLQDRQIPPYVSVLRIHGPFLFGTTEKLEASTAHPDHLANIVIIRLRDMTALDGTGVHALENCVQRLQHAGKHVLLCGAQEQPARLLEKTNFEEHVGPGNILPHFEQALQRARELAGEFDGIGEELARDQKMLSV